MQDQRSKSLRDPERHQKSIISSLAYDKQFLKTSFTCVDNILSYFAINQTNGSCHLSSCPGGGENVVDGERDGAVAKRRR